MTLVERLCAAAAAASPSLGARGRARWWPLVGYAWTMSAFTFFGAAFNALSLDDTRAARAAVDHAGWWLLALPLPPCDAALALGGRAREKDADHATRAQNVWCPLYRRIRQHARRRARRAPRPRPRRCEEPRGGV